MGEFIEWYMDYTGFIMRISEARKEFIRHPFGYYTLNWGDIIPPAGPDRSTRDFGVFGDGD